MRPAEFCSNSRVRLPSIMIIAGASPEASYYLNLPNNLLFLPISRFSTSSMEVTAWTVPETVVWKVRLPSGLLGISVGQVPCLRSGILKHFP